MATFSKSRDKDGKLRHRARIRVGGKDRSATFDTRGEAVEWAGATETQARAAKRGVAGTSNILFAAVIKRYKRDVLPRKSRKKRYVQQQESQLDWWADQFAGHSLRDITSGEISQRRDALAAETSNATANRYCAALSHVFTKAANEWELLPVSPFAKLTKLKESDGRNRFLDDAERKALLAAAGKLRTRKPLLTIIVAAIVTGARKGELLGLLWRDVDFERGRATLRDTKNGSQRVIFFSGYALELLLAHYRFRHPRSRFVFPARCGTKPVDIEREFARALKAASIDDFHFHDLRHTAASYMAMHGKPATDIKAALGHRSVAMVDRYAHLAASHMDEVMRDWSGKVFPQQQGAA